MDEQSQASGRQNREWIRPAVVTAAALAAFTGLTYLVRLALSWSHNPGVESPQFGLWAALIAVSAVTDGFVLSRTIGFVRAWRQRLGVSVVWPLVIYAVGVGAVVTYVWERSRAVDALMPSTVAWIAKIIVVLGMTAAAPSVLGLWLIQCRVRAIAELLEGHSAESRRVDEVLSELIECRRDKSVCLAVLAVIVATAVVDMGALRRAYLVTTTRPELFPSEWVLLYGGLFTLGSVLVYVPVFMTWRSQCLKFVDDVFPLPADARPTDEWLGGRNRLVLLLGAEASVAKNITAAFGILTPLAISVLAVVVPGLK